MRSEESYGSRQNYLFLFPQDFFSRGNGQREDGSPADRAGLESGMVIGQANRRDMTTTAELQAVLDEGVLLLVRASDSSRFVVLRVDGR